LLATKVCGFASLMALAAFNRWRVVPALAVHPVATTRRFQRTLQAEYLLVIGVLTVTVMMTSLFSWH
jgi:putative copper export protein